MSDAPPDTPPPVALRAGELLRQRGVPFEDAVECEAPSPRESGVFPISVRAATYLEAAPLPAAEPDDADAVPVSEPPRSLRPSNLARVLEALRART